MEPIRIRRSPLHPLKRASSGFTVVEMLVVMAIIVVVMGIVLNSQSSFNKTLILSNSAYDIALTLRSAQTFGLGSLANYGAKNAGFGVHFSSGSKSSFILFADTAPTGSPGASNSPNCPSSRAFASAPDCKPGDNAYTAQGARPLTGYDALIQTYTLQNGIIISDFCAKSDTSSWRCTSNGLTSLDIVFARPNADVFMSTNTGGQTFSTYNQTFPITKACLTVHSPQGGYRFITITKSGQIIANASSCP